MSKDDISILYVIPEPYLTHDICLAAVKINGLARNYIPEIELKNYDVLFELVSHRGQDLGLVPPAMRDLNMCLASCGKGSLLSDIYALPFIPESLLEHDTFKDAITRCREIIPKSGVFIQHLPLSLRDIDICIAAVKENWHNFCNSKLPCKMFSLYLTVVVYLLLLAYRLSIVLT